MASQEIAREFPDGVFFVDRSFARKSMPKFLRVPANPSASPIASRDAVIDEEHGIWARIFLPTDQAQGKGEGDSSKLPVVLFFHGGGFVTLSADFCVFHVLCSSIAEKLGALVIGVNYRLAPENRLPAAYEDGFAALKWLADEQGGRRDPWLASHADLSKILVMGDSAGGNLAHHVTVRAAVEDLGEMRIMGQVLIQPFFGGIARFPSETKPQPPNSTLTTDLSDQLWELALPIGASRDHPYCHVVAPDLKAQLREIEALPKALVVAGSEDVLCDRVVEFAEVMRECGKDLELLVVENAGHAFYIVPESEKTAQLLEKISAFVHGLIPKINSKV
ncbi:probable carboxylesterase 120 [Selaginella moellendorffii]|nr:probable carboxylesterase 120 [Selaginella moellendorffii]|eukprot:XP_002975994.2 probable carboxylesterase 120 [Selaginella moellendorffii]